MEPLRCPSEVKFFRNRHKVAKMTQFNIIIHMLEILIECNKILDVWHSKAETADMGTVANQINVEIRTFEVTRDANAFRTLNEEWITLYFALEKKDRLLLEDPQNEILGKGGHIFMVYAEDEAVGCVALLPMDDGVYELSKMAISPRLRGLGIGRKLLGHAIAQARTIGAKSLFLGSSTKLANAVHLYESVGFRHVAPEKIPPMPYTRANVFMELHL